MHVLYLHQYFSTRSGSTGTRSYEFAKRFVKRGHRITMITSGRHAPEELAIPPGRDFTQVDLEGIGVIPIDAAYNNPHVGTGMGGLRRMREFMAFARMAARVGKRLPKPDVVFATHTPLTIGLAGRKLGRHFGVPFVFEVRDLWPQALINSGTLSNPAVIWWLRRMERKIYSAAKHVVALSPGMKAGVVAAGVEASRVTVIPNGCDLDLFSPELDGADARKKLGLGDRFAAIYFGAMGLANGLEYTVEAARILSSRGRSDIVIVLHGDGGRRGELERLVREYGLSNVLIGGPSDKSVVAELVAACDVCLTIFRGTRGEQTWSPNKMFDAFSAGRPVLVNVPGWLGELVEGNSCGRLVDSYDPASLADALEELAADEPLRRRMGQNARALAEREFARDTLSSHLESVLLSATG